MPGPGHLSKCHLTLLQIVLLLGGATARIGDPSGKSSEREMLGDEVIDTNIRGIRENLERVVRNHEAMFWDQGRGQLPDTEIVDNSDWYRRMNIIDFLSSVGRNLRMGRMLARTSVKSRIESDVGLSLTEFTYQAFQVRHECDDYYDPSFVILFRHLIGCISYDLETAGSSWEARTSSVTLWQVRR